MNIIDVIGAHVQLTRRGVSHVGMCPFHASTAPAFHVHPERGFYYCFECQAGGDADGFLRQLSEQPAAKRSLPSGLEFTDEGVRFESINGHRVSLDPEQASALAHSILVRWPTPVPD